jgi:hypothetical protein
MQKHILLKQKEENKKNKSFDILFDENLFENFAGDLLQGFLNGVSVVEEHETDSDGEVFDSVSKVAHFLSVFNYVAVPYSFLDN